LQNLKIIFVLVLVAFMVTGSTFGTVAYAHKKSSSSTSPSTSSDQPSASSNSGQIGSSDKSIGTPSFNSDPPAPSSTPPNTVTPPPTTTTTPPPNTIMTPSTPPITVKVNTTSHHSSTKGHTAAYNWGNSLGVTDGKVGIYDIGAACSNFKGKDADHCGVGYRIAYVTYCLVSSNGCGDGPTTLPNSGTGGTIVRISSLHHSSSSGSSSSSSIGLRQIASNKTDFPNNDPSMIQVHVTSAKKNILGDYELKGELTNIGNSSLQFVQITAHLYDATGQLIGSDIGYTTPSSLDSQHTGTFDIFVTKDTISGTPSSFRLSYDWS
jgi:hypothetical protein